MTMKPSWDDTPEWANWLAMDSSNSWYWYEEKPIKDREYWFNKHGSKTERAEDDDIEWDKSLEKRPI